MPTRGSARDRLIKTCTDETCPFRASSTPASEEAGTDDAMANFMQERDNAFAQLFRYLVGLFELFVIFNLCFEHNNVVDCHWHCIDRDAFYMHGFIFYHAFQ